MVGGHGVGQAGIVGAHHVEVRAEATGSQHHGPGIDGVVVLGVVRLYADRCAALHDDLGGGGIQQNVDVVSLGLLAEPGDEVRAHGAAVLGAVQVFMDGAASGRHLWQGRADALQPFHGLGGVFGHGGDQGQVVDAVASVHGILDELRHAAVGDVQGCLELGIGAVHAAGRLQAVAAHEGHLLQHQHLRTGLSGSYGGGQARAARADDHHVAIQGLGSLLRRSGGFGRDLEGRGIDAGIGQRLPDGVLDGVAGHCRAGNGVHGDAVGRDDGPGQLLHGHRADALGLVLLQHLDAVDGRGVGLHLHHHIAVDALAHALCGDPPGLRRREAQRQQRKYQQD